MLVFLGTTDILALPYVSNGNRQGTSKLIIMIMIIMITTMWLTYVLRSLMGHLTSEVCLHRIRPYGRYYDVTERR